MKKATIIIPTKNKFSRLRIVLKALEPQIDDSIEVMIIFDGCSYEMLTGYEKMHLSYRPVTIVHKENLGRARARNAGIRKAAGEIIIFLDDDRIPSPGYIRQHLLVHKKGRFAVLGKKYNVKYSEQKLADFYKREMNEAVYDQIKKDALEEKNDRLKIFLKRILGRHLDSVTFTTGNSSVRQSDLLAIGMFDENFTGWGVEDVDLGYRLIKDGVRVIRNHHAANFHLLHKINFRDQNADYRRNFDYFAGKIKKDKFSLFIACVINIFSPYNRNKGL